MARDDERYWFLMDDGWRFGRTLIEGDGVIERPAGCHAEFTRSEPNEMYSPGLHAEGRITWEDGSARLVALYKKFGRRPSD